MKKSLEKLVQDQRDLYKNTPDRMIADYNAEKEMIGDYNGRQLLELIQNADDAESHIVEIGLDETNETLTISNTGTPFSEAGFRSLMTPNLSPKTKKRLYRQ